MVDRRAGASQGVADPVRADGPRVVPHDPPPPGLGPVRVELRWCPCGRAHAARRGCPAGPRAQRGHVFLDSN